MTEFDLNLDMTCLVRVVRFFTLNSLPLKTSYSPVTRLMPVKRLSEEHNYNVRFEPATPAHCPSICIWIKLQKHFPTISLSVNILLHPDPLISQNESVPRDVHNSPLAFPSTLTGIKPSPDVCLSSNVHHQVRNGLAGG